ncbi:MAG: nucleotidyltransferase domain-containing protein [Candidatus Riflebacteria bacterium]
MLNCYSPSEQLRAAFNKLEQEFAAIENSLALLVFGSSVNGDFWEHSDIDLFFVLSGDSEDFLECTMLRHDRFNVHVQYFTRASFLKKIDGLIGRPFHTALSSGRFLFCNDPTLEKRVADVCAVPEPDRSLRSLEEYSAALYHLYHARKNLHFKRDFDSRFSFCQALNHYCRALVFRSGSLPRRDPVHQAKQMKILNEEKFLQADLNSETFEFFHQHLCSQAPDFAACLVDLLRQKGEPRTEEQLESDFPQIALHPDPLLSVLESHGLIRHIEQPFSINNHPLFKELAWQIG